jgi:hypothetical protein
MDEAYLGLREQAFFITPKDLEVYLENNEQVFAAVVDIPVNGKMVTLFCSIDGTVSLYYSNGKCDIGLGAKESIRKAAMSFLISSGQCLKVMSAYKSNEIIEQSMQVFLFYKNGIKTQEISMGSHKTKEEKFLNFMIQNVLSSIRELAESAGTVLVDS